MTLEFLFNPSFILSIVLGIWLLSFIDNYLVTHKNVLSSEELLERYFKLVKFRHKIKQRKELKK